MSISYNKNNVFYKYVCAIGLALLLKDIFFNSLRFPVQALTGSAFNIIFLHDIYVCVNKNLGTKSCIYLHEYNLWLEPEGMS